MRLEKIARKLAEDLESDCIGRFHLDTDSAKMKILNALVEVLVPRSELPKSSEMKRAQGS